MSEIEMTINRIKEAAKQCRDMCNYDTDSGHMCNIVRIICERALQIPEMRICERAHTGACKGTGAQFCKSHERDPALDGRAQWCNMEQANVRSVPVVDKSVVDAVKADLDKEMFKDSDPIPANPSVDPIDYVARGFLNGLQYALNLVRDLDNSARAVMSQKPDSYRRALTDAMQLIESRLSGKSVKEPPSAAESKQAVIDCAQALLTGLNTGNVARGSLLHQKLHEVVRLYRDSVEENNETK